MDGRWHDEISDTCYRWTGKALEALGAHGGLRMRFHADPALVANADILVFNHFARFESIVPQYFIYQRTGALCRTVASHDLVEGSDRLAVFLRKIGGVSNRHPRLLPFLATEILHGRKAVIFPEGGMVKDRRVLDEGGGFCIYSRSAGLRRRHHTGAARLALGLEAFKLGMRSLVAAGKEEDLEQWRQRVGLPSIEALIAAAAKPTQMAVGNITFHPLRGGDNLLHRLAERLHLGLGPRLAEELAVEGNMLLAPTDMDIRLAAGLRPADLWQWWERRLLGTAVGALPALDEVFRLRPDRGRWYEQLLGRCITGRMGRLRDRAAERMYRSVTVNLGHLAALLLLDAFERGEERIAAATFHRTLFLAIKTLQESGGVALHEELTDPVSYGALPENRCPALDRVIDIFAASGLVERLPDGYRLLPAIGAESGFDTIRRANPVRVYANEAAPVPAAAAAVRQAAASVDLVTIAEVARLRFSDDRLLYRADRLRPLPPEYAHIAALQTATESGEPFLLVPEARRNLAVLLVHGLLASPAEMRGLGERLHAGGYPVMGVRLSGHGTSPCDLHRRSWSDWLDSVRQGCDVLRTFAPRVVLVGFSAGAALSLLLAAERSDEVAGVVAVSAPLRLRRRSAALAPLLCRLLPFVPNSSENPHINYAHTPLRAVVELDRMSRRLRRRLGRVECPALVLQGSEDPVVDPAGAGDLLALLGSREKRLRVIAADRHAILYDDTGGAQGLVLDFVDALARREPALVGAEIVLPERRRLLVPVLRGILAGVFRQGLAVPRLGRQ